MSRLPGSREIRNTIFAVVAALAVLPGDAGAAGRTTHQFLEAVVSPDGLHVASVEGDASPWGGEPVIRTLIIRSSGGAGATSVTLPCGAVRECWPSSLAWSRDGTSLAFALRSPGSHARSLYSVAADGSHLTKLLAFDGTIKDLRFGPDGRLAMLAIAGANKEVGATQAGAPVTGDLAGPVPEERLAVLENGSLHWQSPPGLFVYEYDFLAGGQGFVGTAAPGDGDNNWWVAKLYRFDAADAHAKVIFAPADARHQIADPVVSKNGNVAFISGIMSDFGSTGGDIFTVPAGGGAAVDITPGMRASARTLAWGCDDRLTAELLAGASTQLVEFPEASSPGAPHMIWQGEETLHGTNGGVSRACPSPITAAVHQNFTTPPEIEIGTPGHWHDLTHSNSGLTLPATARSINWTNDGADVQGWLVLPANVKGKIPLITIVHGGPAAAATPNFMGAGTDRALLEHGYALFFPNPRGSFGQGEAFTAANVRDLGHGDLRDILAGIDAVAARAPVDPDRVGIMGGSYGGFMTMWAVTQTHRFRAGVAAAGISDWLSYYGENGIDEWMIPYFGASVYADPQVYARSAPINFIRNVKTPVFSYVGAADIECPAPQTQEFWHALHDLGVPTSYAIYPGEGHGLRDPAHISDAEGRTLAWFDKYLK
ncbi:MAG TPA: prolyl oligopeptidase family serine peptidase [Rhizomicrobium sp.]|jgi:dipeptidyl aminopeptidase/acylaminoacyl peptidase|nr:prolyl oligopeptidase family serine peptidase [Rhizomicrobium sp.]